MRRTLPDDGGATFEQLLAGAQHSLWRFEQQPVYAIDDEMELLRAYVDGRPMDPNQQPSLRGWFDQVRAMTQRGVHIGRLRIVERPPTLYQRWLQHIDRWNREAGEQILYLPRPAYAVNVLSRLPRTWTPFPGAGAADWWLIDNQLAVLMHFDRDGVLFKITVSENPLEIADAIIFQDEAEQLAREIATPAVRRAA